METVIQLIDALGGLVGMLTGILIANKLTTYRIQQLEKRMDKHNDVIERTYVVEGKVKELQHDVQGLKAYHKPH